MANLDMYFITNIWTHVLNVYRMVGYLKYSIMVLKRHSLQMSLQMFDHGFYCVAG